MNSTHMPLYTNILPINYLCAILVVNKKINVITFFTHKNNKTVCNGSPHKHFVLITVVVNKKTKHKLTIK